MIYYVTDSSYRRALAFYELALSHTARAEVISGGLQEYILAGMCFTLRLNRG